MQRTRNGFYSHFDTAKRKKYTDEERQHIVKLKQEGVSVREIATQLDIPYGSIHYILREYGEVNLNTSRPSSKYLTRAEAMYIYDITNSQFDYYRNKCKDKVVKQDNIVYVERSVFEDYVVDKDGYKQRKWNVKESKVQADIIKYLKSVGAYVVKVQMANRSGIPDLIACYKGRFIGIEVKTPDTKNNTSNLQEYNIAQIQKAKGLALVAWTVEQTKEIIKGIDDETI